MSDSEEKKGDQRALGDLRGRLRESAYAGGFKRFKNEIMQLLGLEKAPCDSGMARLVADPKYVPLTVSLEAFSSKVFAATGDAAGGVAWMYDPRNRIMTPHVSSYGSLAEMLADHALWLTDTSTDPTRAVAALEGAIRRTKEYALRTKLKHALMRKGFEEATELRAQLRELTGDPAATEMPEVWPEGSGPTEAPAP